MVTQTQTKEARVGLRLPRELKESWEQAAELEGRSLSDVIIASMTDTVADIIEKHRFLHISRSSVTQMLTDLENPPTPNDALRRAAKDYKEAIAEGEWIVRH
ncbi:hypothetical protein AGMMS50276_21950 [Synergistales bacterium]|nr:hypothetical protein AGMMS50276_21950 [Synergistales bacterium]